ncbi:MAG: hypothetical protein H0X39_13985 [Actinobacteria bacterium]|nr:hypothetical protein [Actinomycetota bacterium]
MLFRIWVTIAAVTALVCVQVAPAHDPAGRAEPQISTVLINKQLTPLVLLSIVDADSVKAIPTARLAASARRVGLRRAEALPVVRLSGVRWRVPLRSLLKGTWKVSVLVRGRDVAPRDVGLVFVRR